MNDSLRAAIIGVLAILAIGLAAISLDAPTVERGDPGANGAGNGEGGYITPQQPDAMPGDVVVVPYASEILTLLFVFVAIIFIIYAMFYRREAATMFLAFIAFVAILLILTQYIALPDVFPGPAEMAPENETAPGGPGGEEEATEPASPFSWAFLVVLGIAVVTLFAVVMKTGLITDPDEVDRDAETEPTPTAVSMGRAAGRAADRLEAEYDFDNGVYRAWQDMTELLEIDDPDTTTPGEFAAVAADAGFGRDDAHELTRLFEDVRYGGTEPTETDEQRAITIFRRIESRYAEVEE